MVCMDNRSDRVAWRASCLLLIRFKIQIASCRHQRSGLKIVSFEVFAGLAMGCGASHQIDAASGHTDPRIGREMTPKKDTDFTEEPNDIKTAAKSAEVLPVGETDKEPDLSAYTSFHVARERNRVDAGKEITTCLENPGDIEQGSFTLAVNTNNVDELLNISEAGKDFQDKQRGKADSKETECSEIESQSQDLISGKEKGDSCHQHKLVENVGDANHTAGIVEKLPRNKLEIEGKELHYTETEKGSGQCEQNVSEVETTDGRECKNVIVKRTSDLVEEAANDYGRTDVHVNEKEVINCVAGGDYCDTDSRAKMHEENETETMEGQHDEENNGIMAQIKTESESLFPGSAPTTNTQSSVCVSQTESLCSGAIENQVRCETENSTEIAFAVIQGSLTGDGQISPQNPSKSSDTSPNKLTAPSIDVPSSASLQNIQELNDYTAQTDTSEPTSLQLNSETSYHGSTPVSPQTEQGPKEDSKPLETAAREPTFSHNGQELDDNLALETAADKSSSSQSVGRPNDSPRPESDPSDRKARERDVKAELKLATALRVACKALPCQHILNIASPNVTSLQLMRALPSRESNLGALMSRLVNLRELDLSGNHLGPQGFRVVCLAVARNSTLRSLNLANNQGDTDSSACIGVMLSHNCSLESLDVSGNNLGKDYFSRCVGPALKQNKSLKRLKFSSCAASDVSLICEALNSEGGNKTLEEMDASNNQLGDSFGKSLAEILKRTDCPLRRLDVHRTDIGAEGMAALSKGIQTNTSLTTINAGGHEVANVGSLMHLIVACIGHPKLYDVTLENTKVLCDEDLEKWREHTVSLHKTVPVLCRLNLSGCSLTDDRLVNLAELVPGMLRDLTLLTLSNNELLTPEGVIGLCRSTGNQEVSFKLECLDLSLNDADDITKVLQKTPLLTKLKTLILKKCKISSASVCQLNELICKEAPNDCGLTSLILDGVKLSGTDALQRMLGNEAPTMHFTLLSLSLSGCSLNDKDVKSLMVALGQTLRLTELNLSSNRLTDSTINNLLENLTNKCSLVSLNFSMNKIRSSGAENLSDSITDKLDELTSLSLANNCIGLSGLVALVRRLTPASELCYLDLKNQQQPVGEEDMDKIFHAVAETLGITLDDARVACRDYPVLPPKFTLILTGLGGLPGELGPILDSIAVQTDYSARHRRTLTLFDALHISAVLSSAAQQPLRLSRKDWDLVIGADKGTPTWLQLASHRSCAVYISNLALSVTSEKLEGLLEDEADSSVKEIYLVKDQILRKPTGIAWVLFCDEDSVQKALDLYDSGQAFIYGTPFTISPINVSILTENEDREHVEATARLEMTQRSLNRKEEQTTHATLIQANYEQTQARHQYAAQHPAYADGRVW